ncbi:MAG: hypothetical protein JSS75_08445 [Bacteroidetes bacterium]|nr:hypothetical protein [Bacteroidota bacterium]
MRPTSYPWLLLCIAVAFATSARSQTIARPYPFTMPSRDTVASLALPSDSTQFAGAHGACMRSPEGHIIGTDGTRIRFFGTSLLANAQFLPSPDARTVAARLRKLGFNCVHFANNDYTNIDDASFFKYRDSAGQINKSSYVVNPLQLAKFDTLFSELKRNGIYTDFTLLTNHRYLAGDGLMYPDSVYPTAVLAPLIDPAAARLEREWARTLLTHRNPLTGLRYADDPAFAVIEYNYEHSLYYYWNSLDRLIYIDQNNYNKGKNTISWNYSRRLDTLYASFLQSKYVTDQALKNAWGGNIVVSNKELLTNGSFENVFSNAWVLTLRSSATAVAVTGDGGVDSSIFEKIRINSLSARPAPADVIYSNSSSYLGKDTLYTLTLWAKMNYDAKNLPGKTSRSITLSYVNATAGGRGGISQMQTIDTSWRQYSFVLRPTASGTHQISIQCGNELGDVWLDAVSVRMRAENTLGPNEHLSTATVLRLHNDGTLRSQPLQRVRDQLAFYNALEQTFFASMDSLVKDTLKFHGLVNHRQHNYWVQLPDVYTGSGSDVMIMHEANDFLSARAGKTYADSTWMIRNTSMTKSKTGSVLPILAAGSVQGKAMMLGDFQIPWPNQYNSEQMLLLPAWAAYQDWDGIFFGPYSTSRSELFADSLINPFKAGGSFNSIVNNPATLALAPVASALFRNGLVSSAGFSDSLLHDADDVWLSPVFTPARGAFGVEGPLENNVFTQFGLRQSFNSTRHKQAAEYPYLADSAAKTCDTKELYWDQTNGLFTITTPMILGACGLFGRDTTVIGALRFARTDAAAGKEQFSLALLSTDGQPIDSSARLFLSLTTRAQNTGIVWVDSNGFGKNFGTAPTVMSAATVTLVLQTTKDTLRLTPLDGRGAPIANADIVGIRLPQTGSITVVLDQAQTRTPWYAVTLSSTVDPASIGETITAAETSVDVFPNPIVHAATATIRSVVSGRVRISLVDAVGRTAKSLYDGASASGMLNIPFEMSGLSSGVYSMIVETPTGVRNKRIVKVQ